MSFFHGGGRRRAFFEGWYFKHQSEEGSLALIPAVHTDAAGRRSASIQIITEEASALVPFPASDFSAAPDRLRVRVGRNLFTGQGVLLSLRTGALQVTGQLRYGPSAALKSDIMGPFRFVPGMECRHGVISMGHSLEGTLEINGRPRRFDGGAGYLETDRGRSFPSSYLWTQCLWRERRCCSVMLSVARIPMPLGRFTGCICAILYGGREYRLATYLGARATRWSPTGAEIRQGNCRLEVSLLEERGRPLRAPEAGNMSRVIREGLCCTVRYRFWDGLTLIFDHTDGRASFEYADREKDT